MRRGHRRGSHGPEFGGSGEDSFVAVVVTKLTGALLFILLLTMVIMALIPKAAELPKGSAGAGQADDVPELAIATPERLPEAIAGRPYEVALAATGGRGPLRWSIIQGELPEGLTLDPEAGLIGGTPRVGTPEPTRLLVRVRDGSSQATRSARLVVYKPDAPLSVPSRWRPALPPVPWRAWLDQGFGFLLLWAAHLAGMNAVATLQRWSVARAGAEVGAARALGLRFGVYRGAVRLATVAATVGLAAWLWLPRG